MTTQQKFNLTLFFFGHIWIAVGLWELISWPAIPLVCGVFCVVLAFVDLA